MAILVPEFKGPVTLAVSAEDARREALGRTLGLVGAGIGVTGAMLYLSANPALKAALRRQAGFSMTLTAEEARRDALGKVLALVGTGVGIVGSAMAFAANPESRKRMPFLAALAKPQNVAVLSVAVGAGIYWMIQQQNKALETRYVKA
jgi:uncharacterized membrane protein